MSEISPLTLAIQKANREGRPARIPFLTAGFPDKETFWESLFELAENGADIVEIGIPFSDPVADGPVVALASQKALGLGVNISFILEGLKKKTLKIPVVLMSYANPLLQFAFKRALGNSFKEKSEKSLVILAEALKEAGVSGVIVPDVPLDESEMFHKAFDGVGLDYIVLVGPNTSLERMKEFVKIARGYVYVVSVLGTTGVRDGFPPDLKETLTRAKEAFNIPLALGFGIKTPSQLVDLDPYPDAVIFGSALLNHLAEKKSVKEFMEPWVKKI